MSEQTFVSQLAEAEVLARDTLRRLESAEPLSQVLPAARRLAKIVDHSVAAQWLEWEIAGWRAEALPGEAAAPSETRQAAYLIWEPLHLIEDPIKAAAAMMASGSPDAANLPRSTPTLLITAPIAVLETEEKPPAIQPGLKASEYEMRLASTINAHQRSVLLTRVRAAVHAFASEVLQDLIGQRSRIAILGPDAVTVFAAGAELLERLTAAVDDLGRPGREASACIEARSALEQIGLKLSRHDQPYTSPVDGRTYDPRTSETHRLHVVLDDLWGRSDGERQQALGDAHSLVQRVRSIAGRAKTQPVRHADAFAAVEAAYRVAHAICFAGGFPPR